MAAFVIRGDNQMTLQEMLRIALRHFTAMADAMVAACVRKAAETGEPLAIPEREAPPRRGRRPSAEPDARGWVLMVERNSDTRRNHV